MTSLSLSIKFTYERVMRNILSFKHDENYLNNLWYYLIWKMILTCFSITSIINFMIFLIFLWLCTLIIFWSTHSHYLNIENMYEWYSNDYEKSACNVISRNTSFMQLKSHILIWLFLMMILKWILWKLKQLSAEKTHKIFIIYNHFLNLWIFINDSYNISQKLYDFLWTW